MRSRSRAARPADVFASASPIYTQDLYRNGLVGKPRTFATNSLVLAVPRSNPAKIHSVFDLAKRPKLKLVVAGQKVPIGLYTREVLKRLALLRVLRKAVSQEPDVKGIVGKLALGEADAGFVYATDVRAASSRLIAIPLPKRSQPTVRYEVAVVTGVEQSRGRARVRRRPAQHRRQARAGESRLRATVRNPFAAALAVATAIALSFLILPIVAIFLQIPPGQLIEGMTAPAAVDALIVTLKTNLIANALILLFGTPTAYLIATRSFRGRALLVTAVELPLVLPPAVAGIGLLAAFGRIGLLGGTLGFFGLEIGFTQVAVVMAVMFVASPFYLRAGISAFEAVDPSLTGAARTLGAGPGRTFFRVALPLAAGGLGGGWALAFARGIGEFGATIMFAGSLQGVTQTLSLAVYEQFDVDFDVALAIGAELVIVSAAILLAVKLVPSWTSSTSTSTTLSAPSASR